MKCQAVSYPNFILQKAQKSFVAFHRPQIAPQQWQNFSAAAATRWQRHFTDSAPAAAPSTEQNPWETGSAQPWAPARRDSSERDGGWRECSGVTAVTRCFSRAEAAFPPHIPVSLAHPAGCGRGPAPGRALPPGSRSPLTDDVVPGGAHLVQVDVCSGKALGVHQRFVHPDALLL